MTQLEISGILKEHNQILIFSNLDGDCSSQSYVATLPEIMTRMPSNNIRGCIRQ